MTQGADLTVKLIAKKKLVAVMDGSYIKDQYPDLCSAAFVLECTQGRGRVVGAFPKSSAVANAI